MLCPEVWNFPPPKVITTNKKTDNLEVAFKTIQMNSFYKSIIITCPDELSMPAALREVLTEDTDYYKILNCSLTEFVDPCFVQSFVKSGEFYCLSVDNNCIVDNCASVTPDGILTLHLLEYVFQTVGLEGTKRPHNYYEVRIDLKNITNTKKVVNCLSRLQSFNFHITWEPSDETVCPSSIAKYFYDRDISILLQTTKIKTISPSVSEIPVLEDTEVVELVEWVGMLAHEAELSPTEDYISGYFQPTSEFSLKSTRISLLIAEGFFTNSVLNKICTMLSALAQSRDIEHYWNSISIQSCEDSLWQWHPGSPKMFQAHDSSTSVFFKTKGQVIHSVGELKYS